MPRVVMLFLAVAAVVGCTAQSGELSDPPAIEASCELDATGFTPKQYPIIDILFVVDRGPAMLAHAAGLADQLRELGVGIDEGRPDLHVGVVAADGRRMSAAPTVASCPAPDGAFIASERRPWFSCGDDPAGVCQDRNVDGELGDALACIGALPVSHGAGRQPLEAAVAALEDPASEGFVRPGADALFILIIAGGDDQSPGDVDAYVERLSEHLAWPSHLAVGVIAPPGAERLNALASRFEPLLESVSISEPSWRQAVNWLSVLWRDILPGSCIRDYDGAWVRADPTDLDPDNPGVQPDCVVTARDEPNRAGLAAGTRIPPCRMASPTLPLPDNPSPCWWLDEAPGLRCELHPRTEGIRWSRWQCASECR